MAYTDYYTNANRAQVEITAEAPESEAIAAAGAIENRIGGTFTSAEAYLSVTISDEEMSAVKAGFEIDAETGDSRTYVEINADEVSINGQPYSPGNDNFTNPPMEEYDRNTLDRDITVNDSANAPWNFGNALRNALPDNAAEILEEGFYESADSGQPYTIELDLSNLFSKYQCSFVSFDEEYKATTSYTLNPNYATNIAFSVMGEDIEDPTHGMLYIKRSNLTIEIHCHMTTDTEDPTIYFDNIESIKYYNQALDLDKTIIRLWKEKSGGGGGSVDSTPLFNGLLDFSTDNVILPTVSSYNYPQVNMSDVNNWINWLGYPLERMVIKVDVYKPTDTWIPVSVPIDTLGANTISIMIPLGEAVQIHRFGTGGSEGQDEWTHCMRLQHRFNAGFYNLGTPWELGDCDYSGDVYEFNFEMTYPSSFNKIEYTYPVFGAGVPLGKTVTYPNMDNDWYSYTVVLGQDANSNECSCYHQGNIPEHPTNEE